MNRLLRFSWPVALLAAIALPAWAIQPGHWVHNTEADYSPGKNDQTIVTNLGDVKLAMATKVIGQVPESASVIYDMQAVGNGDVYLAAGPEAKLLRRHGEKIEEVLSLPGEQVFCLDLDAKGRLLVAVSGAKSRLAVLDGNKLVTLVDLEGVRYVWDMLPDGQKAVYLATGTPGKLLRVDLVKAAAQPVAAAAAKGKDKDKDKEKAKPHAATQKNEEAPEAVKVRHPAIDELLDLTQANILCLGRDQQGRIYAGTDTDGLVFRVTLGADGAVAEKYVLYDAPEPEIGALAVMPDGTVYAGTADAEQARPGRLTEAAATAGGRPEVEKADGKPEAPKEPGRIPAVPPTPPPVGGDKPPKPATPAPARASREGDDQINDETPVPVRPKKKSAGLSADDVMSHPTGAEELAAGETTPQSAAEPTPEQRDELRRVIRQRLEDARKSGSLQATPVQRRARPRASAPRPAGGPSAAAANTPARKDGNAVYRITPDGFVTEVFRESVMILKLVEIDGKLIVATGNEGAVYRVDPVAGETTMLVDLEPQQVPALLRLSDGGLLLGTANSATLVRMDAGYAKEGRYTSIALDAAQISLWGTLSLLADIPPDTAVAVQTRSGNVQDTEQAIWSSWSKPQKFEHDEKAPPLEPREIMIESPPARFLQYRLVFTGNGQTTAVVDKVSITYVMPNLRPVIASVQATHPESATPGAPAPAGNPSGGAAARAARPALPSPAGAPEAEPEPQTTMNIEWEASDPNGDQLRYTLEYQPAGSKQWLLIAKDLEQTTYEWQTRRVPDGRYVIRVTASDAPDNPPDMAKTAVRRSDPFVVDNTPPAIENVKSKVEKGVVTLAGQAHDALSVIRSIHFGVDSAEHWQPVLPDDLIYDSTTESFTIKIPGLSAGPHMVTLRAVDARNNARYQAVAVDVK